MLTRTAPICPTVIGFGLALTLLAGCGQGGGDADAGTTPAATQSSGAGAAIDEAASAARGAVDDAAAAARGVVDDAADAAGAASERTLSAWRNRVEDYAEKGRAHSMAANLLGDAELTGIVEKLNAKIKSAQEKFRELKTADAGGKAAIVADIERMVGEIPALDEAAIDRLKEIRNQTKPGSPPTKPPSLGDGTGG